MYKIVTPVSHLFKIKTNAERIISYSDYLEGRDHSPAVYPEKEILFHCDLQPIHQFSEQDFEYLLHVKKSKPFLEVVSLHLASCYENPKLLNGVFQPNGNKIEREQLLLNAKNNLERIKSIFGSTVKIALENNNFLKSDAYDIVTDPKFISEIIISNNIYFLFDISHAHISSYNLGLDFNTYINQLPLDRVIQLHICRCSYTDNLAIDSHDFPKAEEWEEVKYFMKTIPSVKYLTIEYYREIDLLIESIKELKIVISNVCK